MDHEDQGILELCWSLIWKVNVDSTTYQYNTCEHGDGHVANLASQQNTKKNNVHLQQLGK